ncbi:MAG: sugar ABC transporter ATP-binding protein [Oscillospiraceae bacterium]|nr:sugar ABC transporter ATP-binding protein [Oscillospiraceae bacterium]
MSKDAILEMKNITKRFGNVTVLDAVDFEVKKGEVHALVGANGAGKSTLMKILNGICPATEGDVYISGEKVCFSTPRDAYKGGVSMIHQELDLVTNLSVSENIFMGREAIKGVSVDREKMKKETQALLDSLNFDIDAGTEVGTLSTAKQQLVLIARTVALNSKLIVMDEPTSSLSVTETEALFKIIKKLKDEGISIIYISHYLEEIFTVADRVTVLRNGQRVSTANIAECTQADVVKWMVGYHVEQGVKKEKEFSDSEEILVVKNLTQKDGFVKDVSFALRKGEVIGLAGVVGSGRSELLKMIYGAEPIQAGEIFVSGKQMEEKSPKASVSMDIGFVPEDRKLEGLALGRSIANNIALPELHIRSRFGVINAKSVREMVKSIVDGFHVKCASTAQLISNLSGGNQQKVAIGKWLSGKFKVIFFDQPTRGVDVGSKSEIYQMIRKLADQDVSMIIASDEIEELLDLCDRILVLQKGQIVCEMRNDGTNLTKAQVLEKMVS